jgi:transglutaminase-like putative cysteine protease
LESDDPEIIGQARAHTREATSAADKMQALERFVHDHISNKSLSVGYASALETLHAQEGDCTEHAVLLAALGRAVGIPTRVVNGLAYADAFVGHERVFVPHAWVQAWIDGRWRSFDAALRGFDGGHIALGTGDGDATGFYAAVSLLGNLEVRAADALETSP